ncbi:uncharacterized protein PV06_09702 [Exophiala oligosperma]|uniref:Fe2OG dioxygenase domain-containing protein n=1 Tax=Exophiala oligosperma TaxID=215243 RepID=A0A0D2BMS3_9EURO|nr:uncharacterized protein PV06_09702 [Exophiala oligosperma]KIW38757.1 hypothetical protein PV06_09702 [Exophiala oligosperma]
MIQTLAHTVEAEYHVGSVKLQATPRPPPVIDFSPFYEGDDNIKADLVQQVKAACLEKGFFQITGHGISEDLQQAMLEQSRDLFSLPTEQKQKYDQANHPNRLGYERLRAQNFEGKTAGDLKEGFFFGRSLPQNHPYVQEGRLHCGQNVYPSEMQDQDRFQKTIDQYHQAMTCLAEDILRVIAMTLDLDRSYFDEFCQEPVSVLRLLHYPPQAVDASEDERGIGAHTDFGTVTILLQDDVGGLQVFDTPTKTWIDVKPTPGALVVNLGSVMMRWSNDTYVANLHRVINKNGRERYSIPFFYSGNPEFLIDCLPGCGDYCSSSSSSSSSSGCQSKYPPIKVQDWISGRHKNTFSEAKGLEELHKLAKIA